eukprot:SAG31_NODE_4607_length_3098_cov_4.930310_1_plen_74_part_00
MLHQHDGIPCDDLRKCHEAATSCICAFECFLSDVLLNSLSTGQIGIRHGFSSSEYASIVWTMMIGHELKLWLR